MNGINGWREDNWIPNTVYVNKKSPYSNSNYLSFTVSIVYQLLFKLLLKYCSVEIKLLSNYCTVWWHFIDIYCIYTIQANTYCLSWYHVSNSFIECVYLMRFKITYNGSDVVQYLFNKWHHFLRLNLIEEDYQMYIYTYGCMK